MQTWLKGQFTPQNPQKYKGNVNNIVYRSSWERAAMSWFDNTPDVLAWESEETIINYFDPVKQKQRRYYMDFKILIKKADGTRQICLVEIKPYKQTIKPRANKNKSEKTIMTEMSTWLTNKAKWDAARELCRQKNWQFVIFTERELFGGLDKGYKPPPKR